MKQDWYSVLSRLNLNQLVAFVVVAELASFRLAATRMNISQSAVSVQVRHLEEALGVPLFHRTTRSVTLTHAGESLLPQAREMCQDLARIATAFRGEAQLERGLVTVVALPAASVTLLPPLMKKYRQIHPQIEVRLVDLDSKAALDTLRAGDADIAVLSRTDGLDDCLFTPLYDDELLLVTPRTSERKGSPSAVSVKAVAQMPLLLNPKGVQLRKLVDEMFAKAGCAPEVRQECMRPQTLLSLVEQGFGVTLLTLSTLAGLDTSRVSSFRLTPRARREIGMVTLRRTSASPAMASFRRFLASQAKGAGGS